eukprot:9492265-Pyramimonas_sp.AAC.1
MMVRRIFINIHSPRGGGCGPPTSLQAPRSRRPKKGLRFQFNSRQSSTVDTSIPLSARHFEYSAEYSTYIPCRQTAAWRADSRLRGLPRCNRGLVRPHRNIYMYSLPGP